MHNTVLKVKILSNTKCWRKAITNLGSILKSRDVTLPTKVYLVKAMVFPVVMCGCESWAIQKAERWRIDAFELWCWRRFLRVPWTAAHQASLSITNSQSLLKLMSIELVMPSNHLILCHSLIHSSNSFSIWLSIYMCTFEKIYCVIELFPFFFFFLSNIVLLSPLPMET